MSEKTQFFSNLFSRISQIVKKEGISKRKFYIKTGLPNGFLDKPRNIGVDSLVNILQNFPTISPAWLLLEDGEMLSVENPKTTTQKIIKGDGNNVQVGHGNESNMNNQNSEIIYIKEIEGLKKEIELLNKNIADKDKIIRLLEK